jgi:hypothetical protein
VVEIGLERVHHLVCAATHATGASRIVATI